MSKQQVNEPLPEMNPPERVAHWQAQVESRKALLDKHNAEFGASFAQEDPEHGYEQGYELDVRKDWAPAVTYHFERQQLLHALQEAKDELHTAKKAVTRTHARDSMSSSGTLDFAEDVAGTHGRGPSSKRSSVESVPDDVQSKDSFRSSVGGETDNAAGGQLAELRAEVAFQKAALDSTLSEWNMFQANEKNQNNIFSGAVGYGGLIQDLLKDLGKAEDELRAAEQASGQPLTGKTAGESYLSAFEIDCGRSDASDDGQPGHATSARDDRSRRRSNSGASDSGWSIIGDGTF
jgi:hypothetical protein